MIRAIDPCEEQHQDLDGPVVTQYKKVGSSTRRRNMQLRDVIRASSEVWLECGDGETDVA